MDIYIVTQQESSADRIPGPYSGKPAPFGTDEEARKDVERRIEEFKRKEKGRKADWVVTPGAMSDTVRHFCCSNDVKEVCINVFITKTELSADGAGKEEEGHGV